MSDINIERKKNRHFLKDYFTIAIPKDVEKVLKKKQYKNELSLIHKDKTAAVEYCLIFLSNLMSKQYDYKDEEKWTTLNSVELKKQIPGSEGRYRRVIELLLKDELSLCPIIEIKKNIKGEETYQSGINSKGYRLSNQFSDKGYIDYNLESTKIRKHREIYIRNKQENALTNPIVKNLLNVYPNITLPNEDEILSEAKRIIIETKEKIKRGDEIKGKILTILNGRKKSSFKDFSNRMAYEDALKNFKFHTYNKKLRLPLPSTKRAGGRVYDSINMMPSFIRNLIKIDNEKVVNVDLKCLHPNLAIKLYGGNMYNITHNFIAGELELDLKTVKKEHLSFFNKNPNQMKKSPLYKYYIEHEHQMLTKLIEDKEKFNYKITSQKMFELEVKIMTECIKKLNERNIYPLYIFDALLVKDSDQITTEYIMNEVVNEMEIYTLVDSNKKNKTFIRMAMLKQIKGKGMVMNATDINEWFSFRHNIPLK